MRHRVLILTSLVFIAISPARAQSHRPSAPPHMAPSYPHASTYTRESGAVGRPTNPNQLTEAQGALLRWGEVGRCVAAINHEASVSYVSAGLGSPEEATAEVKLAPAFTSCFKNSDFIKRNNKALRRAAVADALGLKPAKAS